MKPDTSIPTLTPVEVLKDGKKVINTPIETKEPVVKTPRVTRSTDAVDRVRLRLIKYREADKDEDRGLALDDVVSIVLAHTSPSVLNEVRTFFTEHKEEAFLQERNALSCLKYVKPHNRIKASALYEVMIGIARKTASETNLGTGVIGNLFNTEFANWLSFYLGRSKKRR